MDVMIERMNGESFTLGEHGVIVRDFLVHSIPMENDLGTVEGSDRSIDYGATYGPRPIDVPVTIRAHDLLDFPLLRDKLFGLMNRKESFYIREMRRAKRKQYAFISANEAPSEEDGTDNQLIGGKRYLVRLQSSFGFEQEDVFGDAELSFLTTELPFAESIGTTLDLHRDGIDSESALWGFGMGLTSEEGATDYIHTENAFRVFNAGDVEVHPFESYLRIEVDQVEGSTKDFTLTNRTTGDVFQFKEPLSGTLVIDKNVTLNGSAALGKTNRQFIAIAPGWNEFTVSGATSARVSFDFRFLYQ